MRRRDFIKAIAGSTAVWPLGARAQQRPMPVIGFLSSRSPGESTSVVAAFGQGLNETGYVEGQNVAIEFRWAQGQLDRLPAMAVDLVSRQVAVIINDVRPHRWREREIRKLDCRIVRRYRLRGNGHDRDERQTGDTSARGRRNQPASSTRGSMAAKATSETRIPKASPHEPAAAQPAKRRGFNAAYWYSSRVKSF